MNGILLKRTAIDSCEVEKHNYTILYPDIIILIAQETNMSSDKQKNISYKFSY